MIKIKACSVLFFLFTYNVLSYGGCLKKVFPLLPQNPLRLNSNYLLQFQLLNQQTIYSKELNSLLRDLDSSIFLKLGNLIKFRSKKIFMAISLLDQLGYKNDYFLTQILKGEKLTIIELRAFYLLNKRKFWFEEGLYKHFLSEVMSRLSVMDLLERNLTRQGQSILIPQIDEVIAQFNDKSYIQRVFGKETYEQHYEEQFRDYIKRSDFDPENIADEISHTLQLLAENITHSAFLQKKYYQFRYDQLKIIQHLLVDSALTLKDYKIRYRFIFSQFPNNFKSIEALARLMMILSGSMIFLEFVISEYASSQGAQQLPLAIPTHNIIYHISEAEIIEEKCNSGEILPMHCLTLLSELKK